MKPHRHNNPCPICGGHDGMKRGTGTRCHGFTSDDGEWAQCSREEHAGRLSPHSKTGCFPHKLYGDCPCGSKHGDTPIDIGTARSAREVAVYDYTDETGKLLFQVVRKEPKAFLQRRPNGEWGRGDARLVPYRLQEVIEGVKSGYRIYIAEGERDVETLRRAGCVATCNAGGAGKWEPAFSEFLRDADVTIVEDNDEPGRKHSRKVFASLRGIARSVVVKQALVGKDVTDHIAAGKTLDELVQVWPIPSPEQDPAQWKRTVLLRSTELRADPLVMRTQQDVESEPESPTWPHPLKGRKTILEALSGLTFVAGGPSAGKSWFAIGSAISAARNGWHVLYVSSEMSSRIVFDRALRYLEGIPMPEGFQVIDAGFGANVDALAHMIADTIDHRKTLVVLDSISSFVDQSYTDPNSADFNQMGPLRQLTMWMLNVRRDTHGQVSFLALSERNAAGEVKGRAGAHKADLVISMKTDEETSGIKHIEVTKAWQQQIGELGRFTLDPLTAKFWNMGGTYD